MPKTSKNATRKKIRSVPPRTTFKNTKNTRTSKPRPLQKEGDLLWEIDKLIGTRLGTFGQEYLVKWKGYPDSDNMWIDTLPPFFLKGSPHYLDENPSFTHSSKDLIDRDYKPDKEPASESDDESEVEDDNESEGEEGDDEDSLSENESGYDDDCDADEESEADELATHESIARINPVTSAIKDSNGTEIDKVGDKVEALWPEDTPDGLDHFYPCEILAFHGKNCGVKVQVKWASPDSFSATSWISLYDIRDKKGPSGGFAPIPGSIRKMTFATQAERDAYDAQNDCPKRLSYGPCPGYKASNVCDSSLRNGRVFKSTSK
jgi:hypothetical protein